jgi:Asp/Glu/hydantoin racemase
MSTRSYNSTLNEACVTKPDQEESMTNTSQFKVHIQHIWPDPLKDTLLGASMATVYEQQNELFAEVFGPGLELSINYNDRSVYFSNSPFMELHNNIGLLDGLLRAQEKGCDVAVISCGDDPALAEAREALDIPVVSVTESGMLLACMLGKRFATIGVDPGCERIVEHNLQRYGLESRAIRRNPVRTANFYEDISRWFRDTDYVRETVIPKFEEVARGAIEDGAEVIVTACGSFACFSRMGYSKIGGTEVPVVEAVAAGAQTARALASMRKSFGVSTSKHGSYKGLPPEAGQVLAPFRAFVGGGNAACDRGHR